MIPNQQNNRFLQRANPQIQRALDDSGSSLNHPKTQTLMRTIVDLGLYGNLKLLISSSLAKTRVVGDDTFIPKAYDLSPNNKDAVQTTEASQPSLTDLGFKFNLDLLNISYNLGWTRTQPWTVSCWVKKTLNDGSFIPVLSNFDSTSSASVDCYFQQLSGTVYQAVIYNNHTGRVLAIYPEIFPADTGWHYLVLTYNGDFNANNMRCYIDGVSHTPTTVTNTMSYTGVLGSTTFQINGRNNASYANAGTLNEIILFDKALNQTEVTALYNVPNSFRNINHYWRLDEGTGTTSTDVVNDVVLTFSEAGILTSTGKIGGNAQVDDQNDQYGATPALTQDFTQPYNVSFWLKVADESALGVNRVFHIGDPTTTNYTGIQMFIYGASLNCNIDFGTGAGGSSAHRRSWDKGYVFTQGVWHHVSLNVIDMYDITLYIDGVDIEIPQTSGTAGSTNYSSKILSLFRNSIYTNNDYLHLDEFGIYTKTLTHAEVLQLYNNGLGLSI